MMFSLLVLSGDVELNPGPGNGGGEDGAGLAENCLKPGDLREVVRMVWDGRMKWYRIGLELLPDPAAVTVNVIRADHSRHPDVIECIHEMLQIWLDDGTPTWETLAAALRKPTVHLGRLAYNIERECLSAPDTESAGTHISSIQDLSSLAIDNWNQVGIKLGVTESELRAIQQACSNDVERSVSMLNEWFYSENRATYESLVKALASSGNIKLAKQICSDKGISEDILSNEDCLPVCITEYARYLKEIYLAEPVLRTDPWPPTLCKQYVNVQLISHNELHPTEQSVVNLQNDLIYGDIEHVPQDSKIKLEQVLNPPEDGKPLKVLIDGAPGVGKTTLCRKLAQDWAKGECLQHYSLVVLIQLRDPRMARAESYREFFNPEISKDIVKYVGETQGANLLFIFDGFDELGREHRTDFSSVIRMFKGISLIKSSVLVTSRPHSSEILQDQSALTRHVEVLGFNNDQIFDCVSKATKNQEEAYDLYEQICDKHVQHLVSLCYIPLNCAIIIYMYLVDHSLPETITSMFENFISNTIQRHQKKVNEQSVAHYKKSLSELAYKGLVEDRIVFQEDEVEETLGLMTAHKSYTRKGMVVGYQFLHLTIQEYLAAKWIATELPHNEQVDFMRKNFLDYRFLVSLKFFAGISKLEPPGFDVFLREQGCLALENLSEMSVYYHQSDWFPKFSYRGVNIKRSDVRYMCIILDRLLSLISIIYETQNPMLCHTLTQDCSNLIIVWRDQENFFLVNRGSNLRLLGYLLSQSQRTWDRLEISQDISIRFESFESFDFECSRVKQLILETKPSTCKKLNSILTLPIFKHLEYLELDVVPSLPTPPISIQGNYSCLKHLVIIEHNYSVMESITPIIPMCKVLKSLSVQFSSATHDRDDLLKIFHSMEKNTSIEVLYISVPPDSVLESCMTSSEFDCKSRHFYWYMNDSARHNKNVQGVYSAIDSMLEKNKTVRSFSFSIKLLSGFYHSFHENNPHLMQTFLSKTLTHLTVPYSALSVSDLGELLSNNSRLLSLVIEHSDHYLCKSRKVSDADNEEFFNQLATGLHKNMTLKKFCLRFSLQCDASYSHCYHVHTSNKVCKILHCLQQQSSLEVLIFDYYTRLQASQLSFCSLKYKSQKALFYLLLHNQSLDNIIISGFIFSQKRLREVARALVLNGRRHDMDLMLTEQYYNEEESYKNTETIQIEVNKFKEMMFEALLKILSHILHDRNQQQDVFVDRYITSVLHQWYVLWHKCT